MVQDKVKLDLGCGASSPKGFIGIDSSTTDLQTGEDIHPGVIHDLNDGIPFGDNEANVIRAYHFLEHVKDIHFLLREIYRVACDGAIVDIEVPLYEIGFRIGDGADTLIALERLGPMCHYTVFHSTWFEMYLDPPKWNIVDKRIEWRCLQGNLFFACLNLQIGVIK